MDPSLVGCGVRRLATRLDDSQPDGAATHPMRRENPRSIPRPELEVGAVIGSVAAGLRDHGVDLRCAVTVTHLEVGR
jgi:hypothetical protein